MLKTLVVDDSPTIRRMVMASLRDVCDGGFAEAASGLEAIEQLALEPIALMILDLNMPDMHGLEVLTFVRSHQKYRNIPVVVLTTRSDATSRSATALGGRPTAHGGSIPAIAVTTDDHPRLKKRVLAAGFHTHLAKPLSPDALAAAVRNLLRVS